MKIKKQNTRKNRNKKNYKGGDVNNIEKAEQILQNVQQQSNKFNIPSIDNVTNSITNSRIARLTDRLIDVIVARIITSLGDIIGVDFSDKNDVMSKLDLIKQKVTDPDTVQKLTDDISDYGQVGILVLEALQPFLASLNEIVVTQISNTIQQLAYSSLDVAETTILQIPIVGTAYAAISGISNVLNMGLSVVNTGAEITKATSDTANATIQNFYSLLDQKRALLERTDLTLKGFETNKIQLPNQKNVIKGGNKKTHKKYY